MPLTPAPRIYSYVRFSSEKQLKGDSLRRQNELIDKYTKEKGLELDDEFRLADLGKSAYLGQNVKDGKLGLFLQAVREKKVGPDSVLLVESLDRLTRLKPREALPLFLEIINAGVTIVTLIDRQEHNQKSVDGIGGMTLFASLMVLSRAHEESQTKSNRLKKAWEEKRRNLTKKFYSGRIPSWLQVVEGEVKPIVIKEKAATVKRMFQMCLAGNHCEGIARKFHQEGLPIVGGAKKWSHGFVSQTLRNPSVTGDFTPNKMIEGKRTPAGPTISNFYPAIVSHADFNRVQHIMDSRSKNTAGGRASTEASSLFRKVLFCGYCGEPVYHTAKGRHYNGKLKRTLLCKNAKEGTGCFYVGWNYEEFEKSFLLVATELRATMGDKFDGQTLREEQEELHGEQKLLRTKVGNLVSAIETADATASKDSLRSITAKVTEHERRLSEIEARLNETERKLSAGMEGSAPLLKLEQLAKKLEDGDTRKLVSDQISQLFERIDLFPAGTRFQFAKFQAEHARLVKERGKNDGSVSARMREKFDRRKHRFFEATLSLPGLKRRMKFSDKANATAAVRLDLVEDLPDDA